MRRLVLTPLKIFAVLWVDVDTALVAYHIYLVDMVVKQIRLVLLNQSHVPAPPFRIVYS